MKTIGIALALCLAVSDSVVLTAQEPRPSAGARQVRVVAAQRVRSFSDIFPGKGSVVLVLTLSGFTEHAWNRLPLSSFTVSAGNERYNCALRTAASLEPNMTLRPNSVVGDKRVAFEIPVSATSVTLHVLNQPAIPISLTRKILDTLL